MKTFRQRSRIAFVLLIITTIIILSDLLIYIRFYRDFRASGSDIFAMIINSTKSLFVFAAASALWLTFAIITFIKFSQIKKIFGVNFGSFFGKVTLIGELLGFIALILFLIF